MPAYWNICDWQKERQQSEKKEVDKQVNKRAIFIACSLIRVPKFTFQ